ncbi:Uncharacterised protein [Mycobacteroides abscessus subsp. abscessus]|nr:Uncharacterised protein [Mycobacteroides abscessus subsp. abscessus]
MPSSSRAIDSCRSRSATVVDRDNRLVEPVSSVTRSYEALNAGWASDAPATKRPCARIRRPESWTLVDSMRDASWARQVSTAGPVASGVFTRLP